MSKASGTELGQRRLNGPQTTGRDYTNLSAPQYDIERENDVAVPMHDGVTLLAASNCASPPAQPRSTPHGWPRFRTWHRTVRRSTSPQDGFASRPGVPVLPCRVAKAVPIGEDVEYRIPLVPNARCFKMGYCLQLILTSDDQGPAAPAIMGFRHASVGTSSLNTVRSSPRLVLSIVPAVASTREPR